MTLRDNLEKKEIVVVCGSGGVGKTSVSAALGLGSAKQRRAAVLTIDPAKRLASALGLSGGLGHDTTPVDLPEGDGELQAGMLDMKSAWDDLVERYAPTREVARNIRRNPLYSGLSEHFVGSQGYMAMERLADLHETGRHDLIVIDTPPTRSALDFLDAPKRMTDFVGGSLLKWFAKPYTSAGKLGLKAFNITATPFLKVADRVLGSKVLEDLSDFVVNFQSLYDDFKERASEVLELMRAPITGFVVVTTSEGPSLREARFFVDRLRDEGLPLTGVVVNKVVPQDFGTDEASRALDAVEGADASGIAERISADADAVDVTLSEAHRALQTLRDLAHRDARTLRSLQERADAPVKAVPMLDQDVHDLESLARLGEHLLG